MKHIESYYSLIDARLDEEAVAFREDSLDKPYCSLDVQEETILEEDLEQKITDNADITAGEIAEALTKAKKGKAPGHDGILSECLKYAGQGLIQVLVRLFNLLYQSAFTPPEWQKAITKLLHKKKPANAYRELHAHHPADKHL